MSSLVFKETDMLEQVKPQIDIQGISISSAAAQAVQNIIEEKKLVGYALRVYVSGGGCCGVQFGMALDDNIREVDTAFETEGIKLVIDEVSIDHLRGASIDFIDDPERGAGFIVNNPNAKEHNHSDDACACGGSCACNN
jgi:iron-sulfur cluster assembly accessory protein